MKKIPLIIIPDNENPDEAGVFVDGLIKNIPYRFLLDTGAASSELCSDSYTSSFTKIGEKVSSGVFAPSNLDIIQIPFLKIGPITKKDFLIRRQSYHDSHIQNLLGMDFLKDHYCHFQFDTQHLIVDSPLEEFSELLMTTLHLNSKFHPYLEVKLDSNIQTATSVWDTGASITVVDLHFISQNPQSFKYIGSSKGTDSTGTSFDTPTMIMDKCTIGSYEFPPHRVVGVDLSYMNSATDIPMTMILGYTIIQFANWLFNFPAKKWAITKMNL